MKKKFLLFSLFSIIISFTVNSQKWVEMMHDPSVNFYETQAEFNQYWANKKIERGLGYKQFRRWEHYMEPRVYPKGDITQPSRAYEEFLKYKNRHPELFDLGNNSRSTSWTPLGPTGAPSGGGAGRINFVRFDPTNSNIMYAGSPSGGLWKTTNAGSNWTTNTDQLSIIGCTDIAIDPTNTQIMYMATGDGDASDTYSIGVLKSTNGGTTWNPTDLNWTVNQGRVISRLLIDPTNSSILLAATSNGIYRTTNAGANWTQVRTGNFKDMEFKPGDPNTVYACGTTFWKSTNNGATWSQITSGVPTGVSRLAIGVTPANSSYVYILASNTSYGLLGVYRSTDSGTSFTQRHGSTPNLLGWSSTGSGTGGQGWYDLAIGVSNTNADVLVVGGINIWRSTNGGTSFTINGHWTGTGAPYVHADIHDLIFLPGSGSHYYSGNDGGVFRTTNNGSSWADISNQMEIAQQYRIGLSTSNPSLIIAGHQDNGTNKLNGTNWTEIYGGDGMDCFIDRTNNNRMFASYVYGDYQRSNDGGNTWTNIINGLPGGGGSWLSPWHQDPTVTNTLYCGYANIYKTTNSGNSWTQAGTLTGGTGNVVEFDIAPSNNQIIYAVKRDRIFKTTNGGGTWDNITGSLPVASAYLTNLEISSTDPNKVWVTFSGYSSGNKVFRTTDGGTSWVNYSSGLPNIPANCVVFENGTNDGVYVGMDVGVYYRDNTMPTFIPYMTGMPNVIVTDLEIYYGTNKLRAATYGRSTWEIDLFSTASLAPVANFSGTPTTICPGQSVTFTDLSTFNPTSWSWSFPGGTPNSSTLQNPVVTYSTPGVYSVTLTATNGSGNDAFTQTNYITVTTSQPLPVTEGFEPITFPPSNQWTILDANANGGTWERTINAGGFGTSSASMIFNNFSIDEAGARDQFRTPQFNFTGYSTLNLTFDVAYARYSSTYSDTLQVLISTNCGISWNSIYLKGGNTLSTNGGVNVTSGVFIPTSGQWRTETINLNSYIGQTSVLIAFQNHGRYGQAIYVDNININGTSAVPAPVTNFSGSPTSICVGQTVNFTDLSTNSPTGWSWNFGDGGTSNFQNPNHTYTVAGTYTVTLTASNPGGADPEIKNNYITVLPGPTLSTSGPSSFCTGQSASITVTGGNTYSWNTGQTTATINVSPSSTTTYTVTATGSNGCTATATHLLSLFPNPSPNIFGGTIICSGQSATLTATGGTGYTWSSGQTTSSINISPTSNTTYTVTATNAGGCTGTATITVTVNSLPNVSFSSPGSYCQNDGIITLNQGSPSGGSYTGPGVTGNVFNTNNAGVGIHTLTYSYTNANGCTNTATADVTVSACLGLENADESEITIFPNPVIGTLTINGVTKETMYIVYNTLGQKLLNGMLNGNTVLDLSNLASGVYYLEINHNTWKLIKQ